MYLEFVAAERISMLIPNANTNTVQILDENGEDVTPRSLLQQDHSLK